MIYVLESSENSLKPLLLTSEKMEKFLIFKLINNLAVIYHGKIIRLT